jgi:hypothetical protein
VRAATALAPLAILSFGWSVDLVRPPSAADTPPPALPVTAPADVALSAPAVEVPASATTPGHAPRRPGGATPVVQTGIWSIPADAMVAYLRAEAVMKNADPDCNLSWALLAAIGKVESNHGAGGGPIIGPRLDGKGPFARILDTDAGELDGDRRFDRAVGPMQFLPGTWAVVGVDADADGRRDPQDLDDAALAAAVHLCSGTDDLATPEGRAAAAHRYNHSDAYVALVLRLYADYAASPPVLAMPVLSAIETVTAPGPKSDDDRPGDAAAPGPQPSAAPAPAGSSSGSVFSPTTPTTEPPTEEPTDPTDTPDPTDPASGEPTDPPTDPETCTPPESTEPTGPVVEPTDAPEPLPDETVPANETDPCTPTEEPTETPTEVGPDSEPSTEPTP